VHVWLVNPFDPLPGGDEQLGRYAYLAKMLRDAGHDVTWWSSNFSHRFKRYLDVSPIQREAKTQGLKVRLVPTLAYQGNVSLRRLWSHRVYARRFRRLAENCSRPDLILASSPPLETACDAAELGRRWHVPTVIDIQDQWPDTFVRAIPKALQKLSRLILKPWYNLERRAYKETDAIAGVAQGYVDHGLAVGGDKQHSGVFPIGVDLADMDEATRRGAARYAERWTKPDGQIWMIYSGSLSYSYDFLTIIQAAALSKKRFGDRVRFIMTGRGELAERARDIVEQEHLDNVTLCGFLEYDEWAYLISQADAGFNACIPEVLIYMPNKIFFYMAAGLALLNTIPGQCADLVSEHGSGINYEAGNVNACLSAISELVESPDRLRAMRRASRKLAEEVFDRRIVYARFVAFLDELAAGGC